MYYNLTMLRWTLVRLLRLEDPLGEHHQQVDGAHHEDAAPEPNHADYDRLKQETLVIAGEAHSQCNSNVKYIYYKYITKVKNIFWADTKYFTPRS